VCSLSGLDITGLPALPLTFPGGLVHHGRSNQLVGGNVMSLLTVVSRQNVVRWDDLKVGPTELIGTKHGDGFVRLEENKTKS